MCCCLRHPLRLARECNRSHLGCSHTHATVPLQVLKQTVWFRVMPEGANPHWFWLTKAAHRTLYTSLGMNAASVELEWPDQKPGDSALCWCPSASTCTTLSEFFAVGRVRVDCGPGRVVSTDEQTCICENGYFEDGGLCIKCPEDSYCTNGDRHDCPGNARTLGGGHATIEACVCQLLDFNGFE